MYITIYHTSGVGVSSTAYELLNLSALKISTLYKNRIFQCMGKIFCVEFQRVPLKFRTKYLTYTLKNFVFIQIWRFKSSQIWELIHVFLDTPGPNNGDVPKHNVFYSYMVIQLFKSDGFLAGWVNYINYGHVIGGAFLKRIVAYNFNFIIVNPSLCRKLNAL